MVQMTRAALQQLIDSRIVTNNIGGITAVILNDILTDIVDSADILPSGSLAPQIREFSIQGQATTVDPGTTLASGNRTFLFNVTESDNVQGTLTLTQGASTLSTTIDPKDSSVVVAINAVTLNGGEDVVFTLSGTDTFMNNFNRTFIVTARSDDDYVYYNTEADSNPADFDINAASRIPFVNTNQSFTIPDFMGNRFLTIIQKATEPALTGILIDGLNQIDAFTLTASALNVNAAPFNAYVSNNALVGSVVSGDTVTLVR